MRPFVWKTLPSKPDAVAKDGSLVRVLLSTSQGSMAHFELGPGLVSEAIEMRDVEEIWYFTSGRGQMWRKSDQQSEIVDVHTDVCLTLPKGTRMQFRSFGFSPLCAIGITMPKWTEEIDPPRVEGVWQPSVRPC